MDLIVERIPWYVSGPVIGLVMIGLRWAANKPLGATGAYIDVVDWAHKPGRGLGWRGLFLLGLVLGGLSWSLLAGRPAVATTHAALAETLGPSLATQAAVLAVGGALMGFGARMAGGCTSGHGLCGTSLGSAASFVSTATFMAVAVAMTFLMALVLP